MTNKGNPNTFGIFILFVTFILSYHSVSAQNMMAEPFYSDRFLPTANITHIAEDREGFLWYASDEGLWRDDGYRVDAFRNDNANPSFWKSNNILDIACAKDGRVWVATDAGLYYINKEDYKVVPIEHRLISGSRINNISLVNDGTLWVIAERNILHLSPSGEIIHTYRAQNEGDGSKFVNAVFSDSRNNLWMTECRGGLLRYNTSTDHFDRCKWPDNCEPYGGIYEDKKNGCFWVATWGRGIVKYIPVGTAYDGEVTFQPCTFEGNTSKGQIISLQGRGNTLWCSAMDGFYAYDITSDGSLAPHSIDGMIPKGKNIFASITKDHNDNLLVASFSPRPFIIHPQDYTITRHSLSQVLKSTGMEMVASDAAIDRDGYVWLWHLRFGVVLYNPHTGECNIAKNLLKWDLPSHIMERDSHGDGIWSNEGKDIYHITHQGMNVQCTKVARLHDTPVCIYVDGRDCLWISTTKGVVRYDQKRKRLTTLSHSTDRITKMYLSADGNRLYYISSLKGLGVIDIHTGKRKLLSDDTFTSICRGPEGKLWIATNLGIVYTIRDSATDNTLSQELRLDNGDAILSLSFDKHGHLWMLTNNYVREYNTQNRTGRTLNARDTEIGIDFFTFMRCHEDRVYVGGAGGYCELSSYSSLDHPNQVQLPIVSSVVTDGRKTIVGSRVHEVTIDHSTINLEINFSSLNHLQQHSITYAYCLHKTGEQPEKWTTLPSGLSTAYFSGLSKGDYTISIKATDEYGNWGETYTDFTIHRLPAWWETWWMLFVYAILLIGLIVYVLHFYFLGKLQRMEIEKLVALAKELRQSQAKEVAVQGGDTEAKDDAPSCPLSKSDMQFLEKARERVMLNIRNANYTTELFASDMCMSRMSLYRRIQHITGQTPTEFMRMIRLHAAAEILKNDDAPVSEVASLVGFATPSYFTKCFKDSFGVLPTEYRKLKVKN